MNLQQLYLILIVTLLLNGCHEPTSPNIRFGLSAAPVSLDPRIATDAISSRINRLLYHALVDFDRESLHFVPDLARWESLTSTHYRFYLGEQGRQFHNGQRLTAQDVKATYEFILEPSHASPHRSSLTVIQAIQVIDDNTLDFILHKPDALFPGRLVVGILPTTLAEKPSYREVMGSGEFRLLAWPQSGQLQLQRLSDGQIVEFLEVKDPVVRALKLIRGELDLLQGDLSPELVHWLNQRAEVQVIKGVGTQFTYLGFNLQDPFTGQLTLRQAIAQAINREEIIRYVLGQAARPASSLLPPNHWAGHPDLPSYSYQPKQAKRLLAQIGISAAQPLHLTYKTSNNPFRLRIATVIQQQLAEVNIKIDLRSYDWGTFYGDIKAGRFQMFSLAWVGIKMPDIFRYAFHSSAVPPSGANRGRWLDAKADALIEQAEQATTLEEQAILYRELQTYIFHALPYVPLWYEDQVLVTRRHVKNYTLAPDGNYDSLNKITVADYVPEHNQSR